LFLIVFRAVKIPNNHQVALGFQYLEKIQFTHETSATIQRGYRKKETLFYLEIVRKYLPEALLEPSTAM